MSGSSRSDETIEVRRVVGASAETAFQAWTSPAQVRKWWAPTQTARCMHCSIDLQVGGSYRLELDDTAGEISCKVHGEFLEIVYPRKLLYTWNARTHEGQVENTLVTVFFEERGEETEIIIRHTGLPDTPIREGHRQGWEDMLASFNTYVAGGYSSNSE